MRVCVAMPVAVAIRLMSGDVCELTMRHRATVLNVKEHIRAIMGKRTDQMILTAEGDQGVRCLEESELLLDLIEWFVLGDVFGERSYKHVTFELELSLITKPKLCVVCEHPALKKCGGCRSVRYCSAECQDIHWPVHKAHCF